jgi:peptide-methionine (S)-S-oxide reductase
MVKPGGISLIFVLFLQAASCAQNAMDKPLPNSTTIMKDRNTETITFGAGCFWCVEAVFQQLKGVYSVESGYSGGQIKNPSYKEVCTGTTGHAEVCQITYDPGEITLEELLEVYWKTHDPTTLNRQGGDVGTQYRSVIFYHTEEQRQVAEDIKARLNNAKIWNDPIVTEIAPFTIFYMAEDYHQEYYFQNSSQPYCKLVITPKLEKFKKIFADKVKEK